MKIIHVYPQRHIRKRLSFDTGVYVTYARLEMLARGKKLGILLSCLPESRNFTHGIRLAQSALEMGVDVYVYFIDDAVKGVEKAEVQALKERGLKLYACAYGANRRNYATSDKAIFAGLTVVNDIIAGTDRFVSFN